MSTADHRFFSHPHRHRPRQLRRMLSLLLIGCFLLALGVHPGALQAADTLAEANFSPSLLSALNSILSQPLVLPISSDDPAFDITGLDLTGKSISSLKGIEYFTELTSLTADYNKMTNLNGVVFPDKIKNLSLAHNALKEASAVHWPEALKQLDLRNNALASPLALALPLGVDFVQLDNNFLKNKIPSPSDRTVTYSGNFICEAGTIRPASLLVKEVTYLSLYSGGQAVVPFVNIYSSTNPNNPVPADMVTASLSRGSEVLKLSRQEYRFLLEANATGTEALTLQLLLSDYMQQQYDEAGQTFYKTKLPVTVWQSAAERLETHPWDNGDGAIENALAGRSLNALVDMSRFTGGTASFSPGLLAQLAETDKKLILAQDFGSLALDSDGLKALIRQAVPYPSASVLLTLSSCELRPTGFSPGRFISKDISSLIYRDFEFDARLQIPGDDTKPLLIGAPAAVTLFLKNQVLSTWDLNHLTAFKDDGNGLVLLGGAYNPVNGSFSYRLDSSGRYGLGTRPKEVRWLDLTLNSTTMTASDGTITNLSAAPMLVQGITMVPARAIFEAMGATVSWSSALNMTTITYGSQVFYLKEGLPIGDSEHKPYVIGGRMLVPLRFISNEIGASVLWWSYGGNLRIVF